ncbi:HalOD1 output domain-containing protein [Halosimplex aquaticum]|uniref:HalOD1 output domain-containing protein n=1 Tax=Halosimplex aquaticum TaxID=3026162 RepID=A0ABD5Y652_9EURY|nr:HalOD1 output domain-containing protein [Halosimplex aquaticum]
MRDRKQGDDTGDTGKKSDAAGETVRFEHYDWDGDDTPSIAVPEAVAAVTNRGVTAIPPLQDVIDADALNAMVRSGDPSAVRVSFAYAGTEVTITGTGRVEITTDRS